MQNIELLSQSIQSGNQESARALTRELLDKGMDPSSILGDALIGGMDAVGRRFREGEIFIPEVLIAARAMHAAMDVLRPALVQSGARPVGKFIIGTVEGDHHDIGKNLVIMFLEGKGFEVVDLGINVPARRFVEEVRKGEARIMGMSALLSTTRPMMKETIDALEEAGLRGSVKIMVGGSAVSGEYAGEIGADAFGKDAASSAGLALELIGRGKGGVS